MDKQRIDKLIDRWQDFTGRQEEPEKFRINPDSERVRLLAEGVLNNEDNHGFKYCPCRLASGNKEVDVRLICPCNFKLQETWEKGGECWCSLFIKDDKK
jgi:ferredoxin-thioredoxin reductase catalytic subunit